MLCGDSVEEGAETLRVRLTGVSPNAHVGSPSTAVLTILENDEGGVLKWQVATYTVSEGTSQVVLTAIRSGGNAGNVTVGYAIAGGSATAPPAAGFDFAGPGAASLTGTLDFGAGVMSRALTIPLVNDGVIEPNETFTVTLQNAQGGATVGSPAVATVTITDNDRTGTVQFSSGAVTAQEYAPSVTLTVTRTGSTSALGSVGYQITGDTASVDGNLSGTVTIPAGKSSQPLVIPLKNDTGWDGNSTLTVTLQAPTGGLALGTPNPATVTLVDDEGTVQFAGATFTVSEGSGVRHDHGDPDGRDGPARHRDLCHRGSRRHGLPRPDSFGLLRGSRLPADPQRLAHVHPRAAQQDVHGPALRGQRGRGPRARGPDAPAHRRHPARPAGCPEHGGPQIQENDAGGALRFSSPNYGVTEGTGTATLTVTRPSNMAGNVTVHWTVANGTGSTERTTAGPSPGP